MEQNLCYHCFQQKPGAGACPHCGYDPTQDAGKYPLALPCGTILCGRYILGAVLGQGGFGITYIAQDYQTKSRVAVKEFFPDTMATRTNSQTVTAFSGQRAESFLYGKTCFLEEAETLAQFIGNPNIIRVYSYFEENATAYFVMEYVEGQSLQSYVRSRGGKLPWEEAKRLFLPVMAALEAVHAKGIIHRDVTPDNIFLSKDGTVKLLDFGAARYSLGDKSRSLDVVLKHGFAPKEQYTRHGRQGPYTDVYALAASMYYVTTGRLPPDSIDRMDEDDLIPPNRLGVAVSAGEEEVLLTALSVQPGDRYQHMQDFMQALQAQNSAPAQPMQPKVTNIREFSPLPTPQPVQPQAKPMPTPQPVQPQKKKSSRLWIPVAAVAAVGVIAVGAVGAGKLIGALKPVAVPTGSTETTEATVQAASDTQAWSEEKHITLDTTAIDPNQKEWVSLEADSYEFEKNGSIKSRTTYEYNSEGLLIRELHRKGDNTLIDWTEYSYDVNGDPLKEVSYKADDSIAYTYQYEKDPSETGVVTRYHYDETNALVNASVEKTDQNGRLLYTKSLDRNGNIKSQVQHMYDSHGNEVKELYIGAGGQTESWTEYRYSYLKDRTLMSEINFDAAGKGTKKYDYVYDLQGNETECIWYNDDGTIKYWDKYEYDSENRMIKDTDLEQDGSVGYWEEYLYDEYGNPSREIFHYSTGDQTDWYTYEYVYDNDGYMLEETCYYKGTKSYYRIYEKAEVLSKYVNNTAFE